MRKAITVLAIIFLVIFLLVGIVFWTLKTNAGQNFLTKQATSFLRKKLKTRVDIQAIRLDVPDWVALEGVYIEDRSGDTLVAGDRLYVNLDMFSLIRGNIGINQVELEGIRLKVNRVLPDTTFNFQFIADAFASSDTTPVDTTASSIEMRLDEFLLKRVHVTYKDAVIGMDADANVSNARVLFSKFNPTRSQYHPTNVALQGTRADLRLYEALVETVVDPDGPEGKPVAPKNPGDTLDVQLGDLNVQDLIFNFKDDISGLKAGVNLGRLAGHVNQTYLENQQVVVRNVVLDNTSAFVEQAKMAQKGTRENASPAPGAADVTSPLGWNIKVGSIKLTDNDLKYDDFNTPKQPKGMDFAHLSVSNLTADLNNFVFSDPTISGSLDRAAFQEQSGFVVQQAKADFAYAEKQTYLRNMYLKTPSTLLRDELVLNYQNQDQLSNDIGKVQVRVRLNNSQLAFSDVLLLVPDLKDTPPFDKNPNGLLKGDALITGTVDNLVISKATFSTLEGTVLRTSGRISGLPDADKLAVNLSIDEMATTRQDLMKILPDSALPTSVELPEKIAITGKVRGGMDDITLDAQINTSLGNGAFAGNVKNATDSVNITYNGQLSFQEFDMGRFLKQPPEELGKITLMTDIDGRGYSPTTMQARLNGVVQSASVKGYTYNNLKLNGTLDKGLADFVAGITDSNINLNLTAKANLNGEYPTVDATADIQKLDLKALNLYEDNLSIQGNIDANLTSTDPANPLGTVAIRNLVLTQDGDPVRLDSLNVRLTADGATKDATITAPFMTAHLSGTYDYARLGDVVLTELNKYFTIPEVTYQPIEGPYAMKLDAQVANHPFIQAFAPGLTRMDPVNFSAQLDSGQDTTMKVAVSVPLLEYDTIRTEKAQLVMSGNGTQATYAASVQKIETEGFRVQKASLGGTITNNNALINLMVKDSVDEVRHTVAAGVRYAVADSAYRVYLRDKLLLDYKPWQADSTGYIQYGSAGLLARDFGISRQGQSLAINSLTEQPNGPLNIKLDSLGIGQFIALVTQDSTLANGRLNGDIVLKDYMETPAFTGDLVLKNLAVTKIPVGDLTIKATNENANRISMDVRLESDLNDAVITGDYVTEGENALDFKLDLRKLSAKTIEAFSFGELRGARGGITGQLDIQGSTDSPRLNGEMKFDSVSFQVKQLGARYRIDGQTVGFNGQTIAFNNFTMLDSLNQSLVVDGNVSIATLPDVGYDLKVRADDFTVLNASRKDNDFFYGKGVIDMALNVKGKGAESIIDGTVKIKSGSDITVILPNDASGAESAEGVVEFVDMSAAIAEEEPDSAKINTNMVVDFASELSLNIEADDKSQFTIVIDELNGDNIKVKGNAQLNTGIAPNGQLYLLGLYELTEGSYDLTFEVLKKQFTIQKGSTILWTGDPMAAEVDITAIYTVRADITALGAPATGKDQALGKVPLDVQLKINGSLTNPAVTFDIVASSTMNSDDARSIEQSSGLANLRNNPAELNKQVFALLVLNKFLTDQSSGSSSSGLNAEGIARQSVSQLLTDQLNLLASDLVKGVNLNFNLNSQAEGGNARTDLNVGLSKAFLNDRLTVSVGRNFELENSNTNAASSNQVFDNLAVNYALSRDGRYMVRAYRKNQYQAVLQGFIIETGVSFIVTLDYDTFRELFQKNIE
ncbi:translocation/assembly module TamB domain-containing protein [Salmonirosea aquatica]|uniref:Translocation/assembly module TamB n=1 Tax=Salmonirosea aquatica TaxID=2654236 RepID=A0A7C9BH92_9BACT|nr:translocation/assembly module TamB [Cytophagaceae bacterium SJW1-29]